MTTDTQKLLQEIKAETGWSEPRIAREIDSSQPTINRLINGQVECKASTWQAIRDLWDRVCKPVEKPKRAPPRTSRTPRKPPTVPP